MDSSPILRPFEISPFSEAWYARIAAFGHGQRDEITSGEAIEVATAAKQHVPVRIEPAA